MEARIIQKYKSKSVAQLLKLATKHFNAYIRKRDSNEGVFKCISCSKYKGKTQLHAGHYYSAGHYPSVRFDEDNVNGQCVRCNTFLHGNLAEYKENLLEKIGKERMQKLQQRVSDAKRNGWKWDRFYLIEIIENYKNK